MENNKNYLETLNDKSVWIFTKQETDFDEAFRATKLFSEIPNIENENIESYFSQHCEEYGISTNRHRILVFAQLFGLITKTPFFKKGQRYNKERPTAVFETIKNFEIGDKRYNTIKTEQILKLKIHAIIDTADNNVGYNILPIPFIYQVLKKLKTKYSINDISVDQLYTYVMTCSGYDQLDEMVDYIANNSPISNYVKDYKDDSRVLTCIDKNSKLFRLENNRISINPDYDSYFEKLFIKKYNLEELHEQLLREVDYSYFLHNVQGFNINLLDKPITDVTEVELLPSTSEEEVDTDEEYLEKVDVLNEKNINTSVGDGAYKVEPMTLKNTESSKKYKANPTLGKISISKSKYLCEIDQSHKTFVSKHDGKQYMEAHHLVPMCRQKEVWDKLNVNVDCVENIACICPTCHRAFHFGENETKLIMLQNLYNKRKQFYESIGLKIDFEELKEYYNIK